MGFKVCVFFVFFFKELNVVVLQRERERMFRMKGPKTEGTKRVRLLRTNGREDVVSKATKRLDVIKNI